MVPPRPGTCLQAPVWSGHVSGIDDRSRRDRAIPQRGSAPRPRSLPPRPLMGSSPAATILCSGLLVKLAYTQVLGACAERRVGSSPTEPIFRFSQEGTVPAYPLAFADRTRRA